jgi:uncharacterized protein (DUF58 family)
VAPASPERPGLTLLRPDAAAARVGQAERVLRRIEWQVVRRLDGLLQGEYRSLFIGAGMDLAGIREYEPGDDVRLIDWSVTARTDRVHVRTYHEDRDLTAWLLLDTSASVDFGTARMRKSDIVVDFAAAMARLLTLHGNRVGAILFSSGVDRVLPPRAGRAQALTIVDQLLRPARAPARGPTRLADVLGRAAEAIRRRSLVFVVSDFLSDPGWEKPLHRLAERNELTAVWLRDPREEEMPDAGPLILEDAETGEQLYVDTHDRRFRDRFQALAERRRATLSATFAREGVELLSLGTDGDVLRDLSQFALRRRSLRHAALRSTGLISAASGAKP